MPARNWAAADVVLSDDVLDRIDEIVAPGVTLNPVEKRLGQPVAATGCPPPIGRTRWPRPEMRAHSSGNSAGRGSL